MLFECDLCGKDYESKKDLTGLPCDCGDGILVEIVDLSPVILDFEKQGIDLTPVMLDSEKGGKEKEDTALESYLRKETENGENRKVQNR